MEPEQTSTEAFPTALDAGSERAFVLRLYVAGATPISQRAIGALSRLCEKELHGRYSLEVIDIYQRPQLAADGQIGAVPMLVRLLPEPVARIVGDLSDTTKVLVGLDLRPKREP